MTVWGICIDASLLWQYTLCDISHITANKKLLSTLLLLLCFTVWCSMFYHSSLSWLQQLSSRLLESTQGRTATATMIFYCKYDILLQPWYHTATMIFSCAVYHRLASNKQSAGGLQWAVQHMLGGGGKNRVSILLRILLLETFPVQHCTYAAVCESIQADLGRVCTSHCGLTSRSTHLWYVRSQWEPNLLSGPAKLWVSELMHCNSCESCESSPLSFKERRLKLSPSRFISMDVTVCQRPQWACLN